MCRNKYRILPLFPKACPDEEERKERLSKESSKDKQSNMKREWAKADFQKATGINAVHLYNAKYDSDTYYNEVIPDSSAATPEDIYIKKEDCFFSPLLNIY